jgi:hypothetical protein
MHGESANKPNQQSRTLIQTLIFQIIQKLIRYRRNLIKQNTHLIFSILARDSKLKIEQNDILLKQCTDSEPMNQFLQRMAKMVWPALDEKCKFSFHERKLSCINASYEVNETASCSI